MRGEDSQIPRGHRRKSWWTRQNGATQGAVVVALLAACAAVAAPAVPALVTRVGSSKAGQIKTVDLVLRDPRWKGGAELPGPADARIPLTAEVTVHNRGQRRTVISRLVITVVEAKVIEACATEGEVPISETYSFALPVDAPPGAVFRVPVSQQQQPDEADRFAVQLGLAGSPITAASYIYRLRFELEVGSESKRVPVGTAVVALPESPDNDAAAYYWGRSYQDGVRSLQGLEYSPAEAARVRACMERQASTLKQLLSAPAELSPALTRVQGDLGR